MVLNTDTPKMSWTANVDKCTDALVEFYSSMEGGQYSRIKAAIKSLHAVGVEVMRSTPDWEKVFQTSQNIVMSKMTNMSHFKLDKKEQLIKSLKDMDEADLRKMGTELLKQHTQW